METISIQKITINNIDQKEALSCIMSFFYATSPRKVGFVNAHAVNWARKDSAYLDIINQFDLLLPDGIGLAIAAKFKGLTLKENLNGTDFCPLLFHLFSEQKRSIFLLGGAPGIAQKAKEFLAEKEPSLAVVGALHGLNSKQREREICEAICSAKPDVLIVGMGVPKQEKWISEHKKNFPIKLYVAVGGLLDFLAGANPRAPIWMRRMGIEWFFRMCCEPRRLWKRYVLGNPQFLYHAAQEAIKEIKGRIKGHA